MLVFKRFKKEEHFSSDKKREKALKLNILEYSKQVSLIIDLQNHLSKEIKGTILVPFGLDTSEIKHHLEKGEFLGETSKIRKMAASQCHSNSYYLFNENKNKFYLYTGVALSEDGVWRPHSWCVDKDTEEIIETTESRIAYFGSKMENKDMLEEFFWGYD